jgi:hypothetical protein
MSLLTEFPAFADLYQQIQQADPAFAKQCMRSWQLYLAGPPNRPTDDEVGLLPVVLHFLRTVERCNLSSVGAAAASSSSSSSSLVGSSSEM